MSTRKRFLAIAVVSSAAICSSANSAAPVIIDSPDQLADGVVNSAKIRAPHPALAASAC